MGVGRGEEKRDLGSGLSKVSQGSSGSFLTLSVFCPFVLCFV